MANALDVSSPLGTLSLSQIDQGEAILIQIEQRLNNNEPFHDLMKKFRSVLPIDVGISTNFSSRDDVQQVCHDGDYLVISSG